MGTTHTSAIAFMDSALSGKCSANGATELRGYSICSSDRWFTRSATDANDRARLLSYIVNVDHTWSDANRQVKGFDQTGFR
jgi:hypothetical protein